MKKFDLVLTDLWEILRCKKWLIAASALLLGALAFGWGVSRDVLYVGDATFRDKGRAESGLRQSMSDLFFGGGGEKYDSEAVSALRSARLMEILIKKRGLQGTLSEKKTPFPLLNTIRDNLKVEWAYLKNKTTPALPDLEKKLSVSDISYEGEIYLPLDLTFLDETTFQVKDGSEGRLEVPYVGKNYRFTLHKTGRDALEGTNFSLRLNPLKKVAKDLAQALLAKADMDDRGLIRLKMLHPDRHDAALLVNTLMEIYQDYLKQEHDRIAQAQLNYLERRENEIAGSLKKVMEDHAASVEKDISSSGFTDSSKELEFLSGQLLHVTHKLMDIELDQKRLAKAYENEFASFDPSARPTADAAIINEMLHKLRDLKMGKASLELALADRKTGNLTKEFQGITLPTAKELYVSLIKDKQTNETALRQLEVVIKELHEPSFEITSLTAILNDPVSHEKIMKASNLSHSLKDTSNRTVRELERIREELQVQKEFLKTHLSESAKLLDLKGKFLEEKHLLLQTAMLEMTEHEMAALKKQLEAYITTRLENLHLEKEMMEHQKDTIKRKLAAIPEKWMQEQLLDQHLHRTQRMVENITSMVESKNISNNLELVQSAPLDAAWPPLHPKPPRLLLLTLAGALMGVLFSSLFFVSKALLTAIPLTLDNLSLNGFKTVGELLYKKGGGPFPLFDKNLDTLRRALSYFPSHRLTLINLTGSGADGSDLLADLLRKKGESVLRLHLDVKPGDATPGLIDYLEGGLTLEAVIHNNTLYQGGGQTYQSSPSNELLAHARFRGLLQELKHRYSWVVASSSVPLASPEAESLIELFDAALVSIGQETYQELKGLLGDLETLRQEKPIAFLKARIL